ncbi:MAG: bifunctional aspartate kinase/homoserine dehydrogenase I [Acidobacteriota bacterium]|nr:bifunctional aspartate kinase/homoserine dehydrogenase I [Acidobacteriota bacterium]
MKVLKFGGTSVRDFERISRVADIVRSAAKESPVAVVVSALGGITDQLLAAATASLDGEEEFVQICDIMQSRHEEVVAQIEDADDREALLATVGECIGELKMILAGVSLVHECSPRTRDKVLSVGERLSSQLVAAVLRQKGTPAQACDARALVVTDRAFGSAAVELETTYARVREHFADARDLQVVTGFLAATPEGETTTLGRGGSDYTASLLGAALEAESIEIWTDVDGVQSADPRRVEGAFSLDQLSYDELLELSHFGAKVVYPPTVHPARKAAIPLVIKNTLNPTFPGTRVVEAADASEHIVRGISSISRIALVRLEGDGMMGIPGTAGRLFRTLADGGINVILISQASSEHSICIAVDPERAGEARTLVHREFDRERDIGLIDDLIVDENLSIVAVVGSDMNDRPGISGRLFDALGRAGINVRAIAQGSSELNISLAVSADDETLTLRTLHDAFFAETRRHLFLLGVGGVGSALLEQLRQTDVFAGWSLSGVANSRRMSLDRGRLDRTTWSPALIDPSEPPDTSEPADLEALASFILTTPGRRIVIDCTASDELVPLYARLLEGGVSVASANKKPFAGAQSDWDRLVAAQATGGGRTYYESTVGAGLPVVRTLQDLVVTGDRLEQVEGLFSGTLGFLTYRLRGGAAFSEALKEAHDLGYTEPDPREDLSGMDVLRKLLILARLGGARLEPDDVALDPLLPAGDWWDLELDELWRRLPDVDAGIAERVAEAAARSRSLTFLARWNEDSATVTVDDVAADHPAASAVESENLFAFTTARYRDRALVIRGPGAGAQVTAAGVFADLVHAAAEGGRS